MKPNQSDKQGLWTKPFVYIAIIAIINILVFSKTSTFDFLIVDDNVLIYENPVITDANIPYKDVFQSKLFGPHYKPLTFLTWKYQYNQSGNNPAPFHTVNWILHLLNSVLLFFIGIKLFQRLYENRKLVLMSSLFLALFFAINPLRLESVAWATERKDVLFTFFFFLSWLAYIRFIKKNNYIWLIVGALLYLLSGLSKSMGLTLLAVIVLTDLWFGRRYIMKTVLEKLPYLAIFGILIYLFGFFGSGIEEVETLASGTRQAGTISKLSYIDNLPFAIQWLLSASLRFILWIVHSFLPFNLSVHYSHEAIFGFFSYAVFVFPLLVAALYWYGWKIRKKTMVVLGGLLFFGLTLSPVLAYTESGYLAFMADRYTYIPSIGLFFILVYYLNTLRTNKAKHAILSYGLVLFFTLTTLSNINNWRNNQTVFTQVLNVNPESEMAYMNLGRNYRLQGQRNQAIEMYSNGLKVLPESAGLYSNRGKVYLDMNNLELALADYNKSLAIEPDDADVLANRAAVYGMQQDWDNCLADLDKALELDPDNLKALSNRGLAHFSMTNYEGTIEDYLNYLEINPNEADINSTLATALLRSGDTEKAIEYYSKAIKISPSRGIYYLNRSYAYNNLGDKVNALKDAEKAQRLKVNVNESYLNGLRQN